MYSLELSIQENRMKLQVSEDIVLGVLNKFSAKLISSRLSFYACSASSSVTSCNIPTEDVTIKRSDWSWLARK